jgi:uncharacterized membrane protein HdeD (DUF308 family)
MLSGQTSAFMTDINAVRARFAQELRTHKGKYIFQGSVFIILGILAAALPQATALSAELLIGTVLLLSGVLQLVLTLKSKIHWWSILSAFLSIGVGAIMVWKPFAGLAFIVTLIAAFMTVEGIFELLLAWQFRLVRNWSWMLFSGIITLLLAAILWIGFPAFDVLYLGWVIAINLILYGLSLMMLVWRVAS